jgi:L-ascorbate metabolism protein UlaG (beta-lactamase superfamily)
MPGVDWHTTDDPSEGPLVAARVETNAVERMKELDFEQRSRLRGVAQLTLSLSFLRTAWRRSLTRTMTAHAGPVPHPPAGTVAITFVGHATVAITTPRARVLTDPMLENSLCGLRRVRAAAIDPQNLADVGLILISHAHRDHLSRPTLARLPRSATLVMPPQCGSLVSDLGFARVIELGAGHRFEFEDLEVVAVPVRHSGARGILDRRRRGASGYIVLTQGRAVYFAGDTGYFSGFAEIGRRFNPDLALLPIAGYQPAPLRQEHMSPLDAVYAFEDLGARVLIPISYGSFELGYEPVAEPIDWLQEVGRSRKLDDALMILGHGQTCLLR